MLFENDYVLRRIAEERIRDRIREAEHARLIRRARVARRGFSYLLFRRPAARLGHLLVVFGQRLESYGVPPKA